MRARLTYLRTFAATGLLLACVAPSAAQFVDPPAEEAWVRIKTVDRDSGRQRRVIGTVRSASPESLVVVPLRSRSEMAVPWESIRELDESDGPVSRGSTVLLGTAAGALLGAATGYLIGEDCSRPAEGPFDLCFSEEVMAVFLGSAGAIGGAVGGLFVPRPHRWRARAIPYRAGLIGAPTGRAGVRLSLSF